MKRNILNIIIDAISLIVFMGMISTGLIINYVLPPGSGRIESLFKGRERPVELYLGLSRHDWGDIHIYISLSFLIVLVIHLILHWSWIKNATFGSKQKPQTIQRKVVSIIIILFIIFSLLFPWIGSRQRISYGDLSPKYEQKK